MEPTNEPTAKPSRDDPLMGTVSESIGGPAGTHAALSRRWWTPVRIALAVATIVVALGFFADQPCRTDGWTDRSDRSMWTSLCYSDVALLYRERGFVDGEIAYRDSALEYPVLTGMVMQATAFAADGLGEVTEGSDTTDPAVAESARFYDVTTILMGLCALVVVAATARTVPRRPWDGMLVAASPLLLLSATINWDLLAVALASVAILAWTRERRVAAGALIGLGAAAKLYPVLLLGPMLLVALRAPDRRAAVRDVAAATATAVLAWAAVNLPVVLWAPEGWRSFFQFNADRQIDFGSTWYAIDIVVPDVLPDRIGPVVVLAGLAALVGIVAVALQAPQPPRLAQLAFLAVAAFLLVNKVWSPQYVLWLLPLAVLARPRVRELACWQAVECLYFVAVWWYLASTFAPDDELISDQVYAAAILLRAGALLCFAGFVVRDMYRPEHDPVRPYIEPALDKGPRRARTGTSSMRASS